ncbi:hypothetical protein FRC06_001739, partial [Ceratobasidium sp. 370]
MSTHFLGYFVTRKELAGIFLDAGGNMGDLHKDSMTVTHLARRCIFRYLYPGRIRVYFDVGIIEDQPMVGITFKIGPDNAKMEDIPKDLLERCRDMFLDDPDLFVRQSDPERWPQGRMYQWRRGDKVMGLVENLDLMESDKQPEF